ncbi:superoxide dismutase family protein [Streptomyces wuyuanensis]|uniref:Superoxide dismutase, Cu-Zn family n=1 Tax=Streptomyces wuyuanensis TaxID=1196353 RepID=A0A1G9ZH61_9ACTN|nr:superoxide dismutase family protein [Streptomyces wuyuanensis]SDN20594.1 superoxide dismutase, Cu-Zn family [Streptomyces wuyuanensis]
MVAAAGALAGAAALVTLAAGAVGAAYGAGEGSGDDDRPGLVAARATSGGFVLPDGTRSDPARPSGGARLSEAIRLSDGTRPPGSVGGPAEGEGVALTAYGRFAPPGSFVPSTALTYDRTLVPPGAWIVVEQSTERSETVVRARVGGLKPGHAFGAHVHTAPCDADPAAAGPHYQHRAAPEAEPANELWLDFTTDAAGEGNAETRHDWGLRRGGAHSVVLHAVQGGAGARVACFTVPFGGYGTS